MSGSSHGQHHALGIERLGVIHHAALVHDELHHRRDVLVRDHDEAPHDRLADLLDDARRRARCSGLSTCSTSPFVFTHLVNDRRIRGDDVHVVLAAEPLLDDLHVQQAEEAAAETEAQRDARLRHVTGKRQSLSCSLPIAAFRCSKSAVLIG